MDRPAEDTGMATFSRRQSQKSGPVGIRRARRGLRPRGEVLAQCQGAKKPSAMGRWLANPQRNSHRKLTVSITLECPRIHGKKEALKALKAAENAQEANAE
jgi:hypothetical protein